jgi:hypothetical protein
VARGGFSGSACRLGDHEGRQLVRSQAKDS